MAGFNEDDSGLPDWKRRHEELYGRLTPNPQLDLIEEDAKREKEADYLIQESATLMHYYTNKPLEEWQPGAELWLN